MFSPFNLLFPFLFTNLASSTIYFQPDPLFDRAPQPSSSTFAPATILQNPDLSSVSETLTSLALELAVLGQLNASRDLVTLLNEYNPCYHRRPGILEPLWFAWDLTSWPGGEEERVTVSLGELEFDARVSWPEIIPDVERTYDRSGLGKLEERLWDLQKLGRKWKTGAKERDREVSLVLAKMLDIVLVLKEEKPGSYEEIGDGEWQWVDEFEDVFVQILSDISRRIRDPEQQRRVAGIRRAWGILKSGVVARFGDVDQELLREKGGLVVESFRERFEKGWVCEVEGIFGE